jgi:hypothetical protein
MMGEDGEGRESVEQPENDNRTKNRRQRRRRRALSLRQGKTPHSGGTRTQPARARPQAQTHASKHCLGGSARPLPRGVRARSSPPSLGRLDAARTNAGRCPAPAGAGGRPGPRCGVRGAPPCRCVDGLRCRCRVGVERARAENGAGTHAWARPVAADSTTPPSLSLSPHDQPWPTPAPWPPGRPAGPGTRSSQHQHQRRRRAVALPSTLAARATGGTPSSRCPTSPDAQRLSGRPSSPRPRRNLHSPTSAAGTASA